MSLPPVSSLVAQGDPRSWGGPTTAFPRSSRFRSGVVPVLRVPKELAGAGEGRQNRGPKPAGQHPSPRPKLNPGLQTTALLGESPCFTSQIRSCRTPTGDASPQPFSRESGMCPVKALRLSTARNQSQETRVPPCQLQAMPFPRGKASSRRVHERDRSPPSSPPRARRQGGQRPALLLRSCFRYFSLSLQSAWHVSVALLVPHRSGLV